MNSRLTFVALIAPALGALACNSILGNDPGNLFDGGAVDAGGFDATFPADAGGGADVAVPIVEAGVDAGQGEPCEMGEKVCFGQCISKGDPLYGCALDGCTPCKSVRASSACAGGACAIAACDPGYADCNRSATDGCETDLSQPSHCGECNAVCPTSAPYCAPSGGSFVCSTNCPAQAPTLCGTQCVDLDTSETHCGDCNTACPVVANGREACVARQCQLTCDAGFHVCGNSCVSNVDPGTCGASCTPCAAPPNAIATCSSAGQCGWICAGGFHVCGGACVANGSVATCGASCSPCPAENATPTCNGTTCGFVCTVGFGDCDKNPVNACETTLGSDPNNCGACGRSCAGNPCVGGQCSVPDAGLPDADAGPG